MSKKVTRYVATYVGRDGMRTLMGPAQGHSTYATRAAAQEWLDAVVANTSRQTLEDVWGSDPRFEVRACECWPGHHDPVSVYFVTVRDATEE